MNTIILPVLPQLITTVIWEKIDTQRGQQARIPLKEKKKS